MADSISSKVGQLEQARQLALADAKHYEQIIPGVLNIIGIQAPIEIQRWGADFLAESFANPSLASPLKQKLSIHVLQTLKELLEAQEGDEAVIKSIIQAAASIYGLVFRYITSNESDQQTWDRMAAIKSNIFRRWDSAAMGIRICCIKFVQRVVQVQTPGVIADPRRPEQNEISLALVSRNHPLIPPPKLEAEAQGLLDRLLNVFQDANSDTLLIDATLNCLAVVVRTRQSVANKIIFDVLRFNPFKNACVPLSVKAKVHIKSMERTTRAFLLNVQRKSENASFVPRIQEYLRRMNNQRQELIDESSRKRGPPEPTDGLENAKRVRLGAGLNGRSSVPPLPAGPISLAQVFTLGPEEALRTFDVTTIPADRINLITLLTLQRLDKARLGEAISAVGSRILELGRAKQAAQPVSHLLPTTSPLDVDEGDDYEPDFEPVEDSEQMMNRLDPSPADDPKESGHEITTAPFRLPQPPPLTAQEAEQLGKGCILRVFGMMKEFPEPSKAPKAGFNRLAASTLDKDAWMTIIIRLATRAPLGLGTKEHDNHGTLTRAQGHNLADGIRETLREYIVDRFRERIPYAIAWLNEEWYADRIEKQRNPKSRQNNYELWTLSVLDGIGHLLDAKDKNLFIRFLSEIPELSAAVLGRIKDLAKDPDMVTFVVRALQYLILLKPPAREIALDAIEDLWRNYDGTQALTRKILERSRPEALRGTGAGTEANGVKQETEASNALVAPPADSVARIDYAMN